MTKAGAPPDVVIDGHGLSVAVVVTRWYPEITTALRDGALRALETVGASAVVHEVPGAFELPLVAKACAQAGADAVVALGLVLRGGTPHFDYVCDAVTTGCTHAALDTGVPIGFGVLTCDDEQQARDRAGLPGSSEDKGREAALAAVEAALTLRALRHPRPRTGF